MAPNLVDSAISYEALISFATRFTSSNPELTTEEVVERFILPQTKLHASSYAHQLTAREVSVPTFLVSHNTQAKFSLILDGLKHHLQGADPAEVFLWIDVFSLNQHVHSPADKSDMDFLESVVQSASGGTLVALDPQGTQVTRAWCLFEIWATLRHRGTEALTFLTPGFAMKDAGAAFSVVDIRQSSARFSPDRTKILDRISGADGKGHRELNVQVKLLYVLQPWDHRDRMQRLLQSWRLGALMHRNLIKWMDKYMSWLELPPSHPNYKSFAIYGPMGSGKSLLAAGLTTIAHTDKVDLRPHAWQFHVSTNASRLSVTSMLRSNAYQLAVRIPETQNYMMNLDPVKIAKIDQPDVAFNMLLRIPLARLAREGKTPPHGVIFLIDGLDEVQTATRNRMPELISMLRELFPLLPTFCRLVCTCRSESDVPHIVQSLRSKLLPMEVSPRDLMPRDDLLMSLEVQLGSGVLEAQATTVEAASRIFKRGGDNMLYAALVAQGMQVGEAHRWSLAELATLPADVPGAYAAYFAYFMSELGPAEADAVISLLQVLVAAREPLSLGQITTMGLKSALKLLPGWGTLFYVSNFRVIIFHKTLRDWLQCQDPALVAAGATERWTDPTLPDASAAAATTPAAATVPPAPAAPVAPASPAPAPRAMKKGMSVKHAVPAPATAAGQTPELASPMPAPAPMRVSIAGPAGQKKREGSSKPGGEEGDGGKDAAAAAEAAAAFDAEFGPAAEQRRRDAAVAAEAANRLSELLGGATRKQMMTADMAARCNLVLQVDQGHLSIASLLLDDIKTGGKFPHAYSLQHVVAHLCLAGDIARLEELILDFDFWENVYSAGFGSQVLKDLLELMPEESAVATDVGRWLRGVHKALILQPRAVLQLAMDAPRASHTSRAAARYYRRPDGQLINKEAQWSANLMVLWEPTAGKITGVAVSPDGLKVAGGSTSKNVRLWDCKTGQPAGILEGPSSVFNCVAYFSDGSKLASGSADKTIRIWDAKTGETTCTFEGHKDSVTAVAVCTDMSKLASGSADKSIRLWDLKLMEEMAVMEGHRDTVYSVSFTMDGMKLASGSGDRTVRLWDVKGKKLLTSMEGHFGLVHCVACSPSTAHVASCSSDKTIRIWDTDSGQMAGMLEGHQSAVTSIAYNSAGTALASCSSDKSFRVWDPKAYTQLLVIERQMGTFNSIGFAQLDNSQLLTASSDKSLRLWDCKTGEELAVLEGHMDSVVSVAVAGDGLRGASASLDKTVRTWDLKVDEQLSVFKGQSGVFTSVVFSPDGSFLATGSDDRTVRLWDARTCQQVAVAEGHTESVRCVAFSPDSNLVASCSDDHTVKQWEVPSGTQVYTPNQIVISTGTILCVVFSPDGTRIATGSSDTYKTVRQWESSSGKQLTEGKGHFGPVNAVAYSPDGTKIASAAGDRTVRVWEAATGHPLQVLEGHDQAVTALAFCPRTGRIVSGGEDLTIRVWEFGGKAWKQTALLTGHNSSIMGLTFHPDGTKVCSCANETVRFWSIPRSANTVAASLNARRSMSESPTMAPRKSANGASPAPTARKSQSGLPWGGTERDAAIPAADPSTDAGSSAGGSVAPGHGGMINCVCFSPSGLLLATASYDKTIRLWDSGSGRVVHVLKGHSGVVNVVVWAPDGTKLASGGADETVRVWCARNGMELFTLQGHSNWVRTVCFSPNSAKLISGSDAGEVRTWDLKSGASIASLQGHKGWVRAVAWAPDDTRVASCCEDKTVRIWDARYHRIVHVLDGHTDAVVCMDFSPDGHFIASGSEDKSVRLWNAGTGRCVAEFRGHYGGITHLHFSPDSAMVASSCADKVFRVWDTKTLKEVKVITPCTDGMWSRDQLLTVAAESGDTVINLWDGHTLAPLAEAYSTSNVRDVAFSGQMVACTVVGMGPENVALYRLNVRRQQSPMHTHGHSHGHCHGEHGHGPTQSTGTGQLVAGSAPMAAGIAADGGRQLSPGRSRVARAGPADEAAMGEDSPAEGAASKGAALRKLALGAGRTSPPRAPLPGQKSKSPTRVLPMGRR